MKRIGAFILTCLMLIPLAACGEAGKTPETTDTGTKATETTAAPETAAPDVLFPGVDWNGRTFSVLAKENTIYNFGNKEIYAEDYTGEPLNDAVYERNMKIEETYGVTIAYTERPQPDDTLRQTVRSMDSAFDLSFNWQSTIGKLAGEGLMYNLLDLAYVDYSQPYWNEDANDALSLGGLLFFTTSDYEIHDKLRSYIVICNGDMAVNFGLGDLQDVADAGKWTIDFMLSCCEAVAQDVNNDGKMKADDVFGLIGGDLKDVGMFTLSMGNKIVDKDDEGKLYISMYTDRMLDSIDKILDLFDKSTSAWPGDLERYSGSENLWDYAANIFYGGSALFTSQNMVVLESCSELCDFDYKVLPMPKYDEAQEKYMTQPDNIALLFGVPLTVEDPDFCGFMLEVLSEASTETTLRTYYEMGCKHRHVNDERSARMLDTIMDGLTYDIGFVYNLGELRNIICDTIPSRRDNVLPVQYAKYEDWALEDIENLMKQYNME